MKRLMHLAACTLILTASTGPAAAQSTGTRVVYINGIQNTLEDAVATRNQIQAVLNFPSIHTDHSKRSFVVSAVWNPVGWNGNTTGPDLKQDKMELFLLKTAEEKFGADFERIVVLHNQSKATDQAAATRVDAYLEDMTPGDNSLESSGKVTDDNMAATRSAAKGLVAHLKSVGPAVVVAHSQGNLLAHLAYARLIADGGDDAARSVRLVNVANTSRYSANGLSFSHAADAALFSSATASALPDQSLETLPSRGSNWTRTTPRCANAGACNFVLAEPTLGAPTSPIPSQSVVDEALDHSIVETYLSSATVPVTHEKGVGFSTIATQFVNRFEDFVYAAAESLALASPYESNPVMRALTEGIYVPVNNVDPIATGLTGCHTRLGRAAQAVQGRFQAVLERRCWMPGLQTWTHWSESAWYLGSDGRWVELNSAEGHYQPVAGNAADWTLGSSQALRMVLATQDLSGPDGAVNYPAGSKRYQMTSSAMGDIYKVFNVGMSKPSLQSVITETQALAVVPFGEPDRYLQGIFKSGGLLDLQGTCKLDVCAGLPSKGLGVWLLQTVHGTELLQLNIPEAMKGFTKLAAREEPFFVLLPGNTALMMGSHLSPGYQSETEAFNRSAMDAQLRARGLPPTPR